MPKQLCLNYVILFEVVGTVGLEPTCDQLRFLYLIRVSRYVPMLCLPIALQALQIIKERFLLQSYCQFSRHAMHRTLKTVNNIKMIPKKWGRFGTITSSPMLSVTFVVVGTPLSQVTFSCAPVHAASPPTGVPILFARTSSCFLASGDHRSSK